MEVWRWKPDREDKKSIYQQIVDYFVTKIKCGDLPPGSPIPTQRELASSFEVNRSTVMEALEELKFLGLLQSKGKRGTWVSRHLPSHLERLPNWQSYIEEGIHNSNKGTLQVINNNEFKDNMLRLGTGEASSELFPGSEMQKILGDIGRTLNKLGYEEPKGMPELRDQVSRYLKSIDIYAPPENILIVSGALQSIQLISMGLLHQGSLVFLEKPSFLYSLEVFQSLGMKRAGIPMDNEGIRVDLLKDYGKKARSSILYTIPNFQNPTGRMMSLERRKLLIKTCEKENIPIIEDDVYRELWIDKPPPVSLKSMDDKGLVLYVGSVSKSLSSGLRIGWIVGPERVIDRLADLKMQIDYGSSSLAQLAVAKWFETGLHQIHTEKLRQSLRQRRDNTLELLACNFGDLARWEIPSGGFFVWVEILADISMQKLFEKAAAHNLIIYPGYLYDTTPNKYIRISYSYASMEDMKRGIKILARIIRELSS
ncbi:MAG: PLP-dependent aminotransferase family protein [Bacillota bacterium]